MRLKLQLNEPTNEHEEEGLRTVSHVLLAVNICPLLSGKLVCRASACVYCNEFEFAFKRV